MSAAPSTTNSAATNGTATGQTASPPPQSVTSDADSRTADGVATLGLVQQARLSRLNRAATAVVATYGQGSSQATTAQQAVASTQTAVSRLAALHQQLTTPAPTVAAAGWALHGRVYDSNLNPLANYTVFLVDGQHNYLSGYGVSYTNDTGYFLINYDGSEKQAAIAPAQSAGASATPAASQPAQPTTTAQGSTAAASVEDTAPAAFLQIADAKANPVLLSTTAFAPSTGQAIYQVVTIPAGAAPLGDPPADVRAVAMPPPGKTS